jgi:D-beta-D-heptose 7-phosphate kinase/D-beta-D-heptose 1-phosphate adenosyltransferase
MSFKAPKVCVIGDLMIDEYIFGSCNRISPEAPVQILNVDTTQYRLGGAGNVVNNLLSLHCNVTLISVVGNDENKKILENLLNKQKLNYTLFSQESRVTTKKTRLMASNQQIMRFDHETSLPLTNEFEKKVIDSIKEQIEDFDIVLLSDYNKGVLTHHVCQSIITLAAEHDKPVLIDPKSKDFSKYKNATLLTPNKFEASDALHFNIANDIQTALLTLKNTFNITYPLITLSEDGIAILQNDTVEIIRTAAKEVYDVTGAGDTVIAALAFALHNGYSLKEAAEFANSAAAVVVAKVGSATASLEEILKVQNDIYKDKIESKIVTLDELLKILPENKKIVFTNGCFDILHPGHASYLNKAKKLGDILIVGLNSDESVRKLKGKNRPVNSQQDRAYMLAALHSTDYIVIFEQETPYELIKAIKPDILVKGADYKNKEVVGSDIAKEVVLIDFMDGKSTTDIIKKIVKHEYGS